MVSRLAGGGGGAKSSTDPAVADQLLAKIEELGKIFWETKQG
jgi:nickel superoxide dismutase